MPDIGDELAALFATPPERPAVLLDRSTLDLYSICPYQAWAIECGGVVDASAPADSGTEAHKALAAAIEAVIDGPPADPYALARVAGQMSRPDVQPDVLDAMMPAVGSLVQYLRYVPVAGRPWRNPADILRYTGGGGERAGQLAWDILPATDARGPVRLTSEVDLLVAAGALSEMEETDFKTGHTWYKLADVQHSFQFTFHAWLLFRNHPQLETLRVRVHMTRFNRFTGWATFGRDRLADYEGRLLTALRARDLALRQAQQDPLGIKTWPGEPQCHRCAARGMCPRLTAPQWRLMQDPVEYAKAALVIAEELESRRSALADYCRDHPEGINLGDGLYYGLKTRKVAKPTKASYGVYTVDAGDVVAESDGDPS